jgi:DnaJ-class molecular chaperone
MSKHLELVCPYCGGNGLWHFTADWANPAETEECPRCQGSGVYHQAWDESLLTDDQCDQCGYIGQVLMIADDYYVPGVRPTWCRACFDKAAGDGDGGSNPPPRLEVANEMHE